MAAKDFMKMVYTAISRDARSIDEEDIDALKSQVSKEQFEILKQASINAMGGYDKINPCKKTPVRRTGEGIQKVDANGVVIKDKTKQPVRYYEKEIDGR